MTVFDHLVYALLWASFGLVHSLLARPDIAAPLHAVFKNYYRLVYNGFAVIHFAAVFWIGEQILGTGSELIVAAPWSDWRWGGFGAGIVLLLVAFSKYDSGRFLGLTQIRNPAASDDESLVIEGLQRYMRHPLYTAAILILWCRAGTEVEFATALWATLYFWIGSRYEERALRRRFGQAYEDYAKGVPAFVPWRIFG